MVHWYSKRIRMLTMFLVLFIVLSLVMTGLFVWRMFVYDSKESPRISEPTASASQECPVRAKAVPLTKLPKGIRDSLGQIEKSIQTKIHDTVSILANVVYLDKVIWQRWFGRMNGSNPSAPKLSNSTVFPIASITKVLTALMLYKLYHEKKVKTLDDPFKNYVPDFSIKDPFNSHDITLREIVSHMSGLPREAPCFPNADKSTVCTTNNSVMLERIKDLSLVVRPGNKISYSNLGFGLLGQGLAFSQNTSYESWIKSNIFDPLGMHNSGFKLTPEVRRKIPVGYLNKVPREPAEWGWASPAGGLFSSIEDIAKMEIKLFNSTDADDFLSPVITEEFFSPAVILDGNQFIGSPWEMQFMDGYVVRMKNGYVYGYSSNIYLFPDLKLAFNIFNTGLLKGCSDMAHKLLTAFHKELITRDIEQHRTFTLEEAAPFVGEFYTEDVPTIEKVFIKHRDGKLQFSVDNRHHFHLNQVSSLTFELIDRRKVKCIRIAVMGINHEKVYFDPPRNYISPGFTVFGFNLQGKAHFYRK